MMIITMMIMTIIMINNDDNNDNNNDDNNNNNNGISVSTEPTELQFAAAKTGRLRLLLNSVLLLVLEREREDMSSSLGRVEWLFFLFFLPGAGRGWGGMVLPSS